MFTQIIRQPVQEQRLQGETVTYTSRPIRESPAGQALRTAALGPCEARVPPSRSASASHPPVGPSSRTRTGPLCLLSPSPRPKSFQGKVRREERQRGGYEEAAAQHLLTIGITCEHSKEEIMIAELRQVIAKNNKLGIT